MEYAVKQAARDSSSVEIPFEELELGIRDLGEGSFKRVQEGRWKGKAVAISTFKNIESYGKCPQPFRGRAGSLKEASLMRMLGQHPHIITFHGLAFDSAGREHLVTELASQGSLLEVLAKVLPEGSGLVEIESVDEWKGWTGPAKS
eukprot:7124061-Pyramimonas_sp.AAC.1